MRTVLRYLSPFVFIRYYDRMKIRSSMLAMLLFLPMTVMAEPRIYFLELEEWSRPRSGQFVASLPAVRDAVAVWESHENAQIQIRYPVGESGNLWAQELSDWLIALGIEAGSIDIVTGSTPQDRVEIALLGVGGKSE